MSNIKINDVPQRVQYLATGGQTQFTVPFPFFQNNFIYVWLNGVQLFMGGAPGQYTVSGAGSPSGGLVTFNTPTILNDIVTIEGIMPIDRTSIYSATISNLTGSDLNGDFNREVVMLQQLNTTQKYLQLQYAPWSLVSQDLSVTKDRYIPLLLPLQSWRMNSAGTEIEVFSTPDSGGLAPDDGTYLVQTSDPDLPDAIPLDSYPSGIMVNQSGSGFQFIRAIAPVPNQTQVENGNGIAGDFLIGLADNAVIPGTSGMGIPAGTTAERVIPTPPSIGLRFNTDSNTLEAFISGIWQIIPSSASGAYLPLAGGTMSGIISMGSNRITNLGSPIAGTDAATVDFVLSTASGRFYIAPVRASATANLAATYNNGASGVGATLTALVNGAAVLDGVTLSLNDRVIFPFQTSSHQNGIYTVTSLGSVSAPAVYTRADDYDEPIDIDPGDSILVTEGLIYAGAGWMETAVVNNIGTDPINFFLFINPNVVTLNTNQTITSTKTFDAPQVFNDKVRINDALETPLSGNTLSIDSGTAYQHKTNLIFPNTASTRNATFQDSDGTLAYLADRGAVLLGTATASSSATLTFTGLTGYSNYMVVWNCLTPATNGAILNFQASTDNGSTWQNSAGSYYQESIYAIGATLGSTSDTTTLTGGVLSGSIHNSTPGPSGFLYFQNLNGATRKGYTGIVSYANSNTLTMASLIPMGWIMTATAVNALRLLMSSGNIVSGTVQVYGLK